MELLKSLLSEGEAVAGYGITSEYWTHRYCIIDTRLDDNIDIALEKTLHKLIESGNTDRIYEIMGAYVPTDEEWEELQEYEEYINIDLSYILGGLLTFFRKLEV